MKWFISAFCVLLVFLLLLFTLSSCSLKQEAEAGGISLSTRENGLFPVSFSFFLPAVSLPVGEMFDFLPFFVVDAFAAAGQSAKELFSLLFRLCG